MKQLLFITFLFSLMISCSTGEKKIKIGYVQITDDEVLNYAKEGVFSVLKDSGYVDGQNIKIIENNAHGDLSMITTILQSFQSQGVDLIITNSTPCMVAAAQIINSIPVVFTVAFGPEQVGMKSTPTNLYGVYDPLNANEVVSIIQECLPSIKRVGLPFNNSEPNAEYSAKIFSHEFEKQGIEVIKTTVNSSNDILMAGQYLLGQNIDAMIVAADNTIYMGLNLLAKIASESKIPLFVTDPHQAKKGAALGIGVNYHKWGILSGLKAIEILKGRRIERPIDPITETEIYVNKSACEKQGLRIPSSFESRTINYYD